MKILEDIKKDLAKALKEKDETTKTVLSVVKSDLENKRIEKKGDLNEEDVIEVLARAVKSRKESIAEYKKGNRDDLVKNEEAEIKVIERYMPKQLNEEEIKKIAQETIKEVGASSPADMGKVMGKLMPKMKGKADGNMVSRIVQSELKP